MEMEMQYKTTSIALEVKAAGEGSLCHIRAYAAAFGNVDSWGDIIPEGAFDDFLKSEDAGRWQLCWQHDMSEVVGIITDKGVDSQGLWFEADILPTSRGEDAAVLLKAGAVREFSIGYIADEYHYEKRDGYPYDIRVLDRVTVVEVSPVTRAANPKAVLLDAKAEGDRPKALGELTDEELAERKAEIDEEYARRVLANL